MNILLLCLASGLLIVFLRILFKFLKSNQALPEAIKDSVKEELRGPNTAGFLTMSKLEKKIWYEEEVAFIFRLIEDISLNLNRDEIARHIVSQVQQFLNAKISVLILIDENTQEARIRYAQGLEEEMVRDLVLKKGESISGWVMQKNEALLVTSLNNEAWFKKINKEVYFKNSFISVALSNDKQPLGVINVCGKKTGEAFTKEDLKFLTSVAKMAAIAFSNVRLHEQMQEGYLKTITALAATIDARDPYTRKHSENVTKYSTEISRQLNCSALDIEMIRRAGLLHDIGKIGIRDEVLLKPGKLNQEEFEQIKLHPQKGEAIVQSLSFLKEISLLIRHHHERYDAGGYPDGLKGEKIVLGARILAVADSFDAMNSDRPYRKRLSPEIIKEELIKNKGTQFDPEIIDCFLGILEKHPEICGWQ
ncbi:MAG: HD-GYP domain-containing protein [Candidatus Omnitrophica bacterium]|nr:HD-GYP domain-containing protein [Candidatus Omnitrophota bacterium]